MVDGRRVRGDRGDGGRRGRSSATAALRIGLALLVLGGTTGVAGCADPGAGSPTPSAVVESAAPSPAATLSDEEALRIAEETYRAYMDAEIAVVNDGGAQPERLDAMATVEFSEVKSRVISKAQNEHLRIEGKPSLELSSLQGVHIIDAVTSITIYTCVDVSGFRITGPDGTDVSGPDRVDRSRMVIRVDNSEISWKLAQAEPWSVSLAC